MEDVPGKDSTKIPRLKKNVAYTSNPGEHDQITTYLTMLTEISLQDESFFRHSMQSANFHAGAPGTIKAPDLQH